jgi:Amt family ammonium transporter
VVGVIGLEPLQMTPAEHIANSINWVWVLVVSFLIFFMQPGFAMLEAGQVRAKNSANVVMKNLMDWSLGVLVWFLLGATVVAVVGGLTDPTVDMAFFSNFAAPGSSSAAWINWLFGAVFAMTAATIVSGAIGGRMKFKSYVAFTVVMVAVIYPVMPGIAWGGGLIAGNGYLGQLIGAGYKDFAGATVVHALGGIAGLTAAYMIGPRKGRFDESGNPRPIPGHSMLLAVLGTLILAFGWYGFNVGTQFQALTVPDGGSLSELAFQGGALGRVALNTTLAMGAGTVASTLVTAYWEGKPDPLFAANGLLAGLVAITGACAHVTWWGGIVIGLIGGAQTPLVYRWVVDSLNVDDVCGVFAVHGSAGFIGTLLIPFFDVAGFSVSQLVMQVVGVLIVGTWGVLATMVALSVIGAVFGLRVDDADEAEGLDQSEHGVSAYPEFTVESGGETAVADGGVHPGEVRTDGGDDEEVA